ncbi:alpha-ketoglutarate-dependent -dichlorophenoxyacetate [Colletotrichum chrysophilum]|uniref:Alpha-ketoglutarate-dependent -dichlorophenoxyacetate n=1 Tax=Colletotrichum chrysophilum TaxID=1836956 RepID=A0AAD9AR87_9PEZI|nr:alpha-ketoglutarate-dependent -dichlorophenoxyacetate [Colletotrichum chrysophilum]
MSTTSTQTTTATLDSPQIRELSPGFGVEVQGLQFAPRVTEENFKLIQDLVIKYGVVVVRKTGLTDETHIALARMFGELDDVKPYNKAGRANRLKYDELFDVGNMEADGSLVDPASPRAQANRGNSFFHVDSSFNPRRAGYSLLLSHELPPPGVGGNTEFCDTRAAWDDLDADFKKELLEKNYVACHSILHSKKLAAPEHFANFEPADYPMGRHRLVQKHERSGRMNLYLAMHIHHIEGLGTRESKELFEKLFEHATQDKYRVMVEWKDVGDLVIWDNTATMHRAVGGEFAYNEGVGEPMKPPCVACYYSGSKCIIPDRGRSRKYAVERADGASIQQAETPNPSPRLASSAVNDDGLIQRGQEGEEASDEDMHEVDENTEMGLRNPSDALHILTRSDPATSGGNRPRGGHQYVLDPEDAAPGPVGSEADSAGGKGRHVAKPRNGSLGERRSILDEYELTQIGVIHSDNVLELLTIYAREYHPYCPLVPPHLLGPSALERIRRVDFFLLTVILTIASRDSTQHSVVHRYCWNHAQSLLLQVLLAVPWTQTPRTVEGLLLLSEWLPHVESKHLTSGNPKDIFGEGRTTWSLVGQAVRLGYALRLDRAAFRGNGSSTSQNMDQNRVIWMFTYIADRQISVRLGQSFWSRGPSLSSNFTAEDFPTLHPAPGLTDEDYASALQANLELTQILHNAHAILYSSTERTLSMIHEGDYPRYLDDFMESATHWDSRWKALETSPNLRAALRLLYEYVCLYINAFSFHAVMTRKLRPRASEEQRNASIRCLTSFFPEGIMSSPDARYINGATRAARSLLVIMNEQDPKHTLRYLPSRYHLYGLYASVFLHKALDADAIQGTAQKEEVASLARRFIAALKEVSSAESHICHGYSDLLGKLWSSKGSKRVAAAQHDKISSVMPVADTSPKAALQEPPHSGADSVGISGCEDRMPASSLSDLAGLKGGTPDFTSFESYLFGSLWPELASVGHSGEQGGLDQDFQFGFNFDSVL